MKKKSVLKKFILMITILLLFTIVFPKQVNAGAAANLANILYALPKGILKLANEWMCDDQHKVNLEISEDGTGEIISYVSPESIIKGKFILLDPNIFKKAVASTGAGDYTDDYYDSGNTELVKDKNDLRASFAAWYVALRNFVLVGMACVLVYIGIRMVISSVSQDKAKYKSMIKDWFVAMCLVVFMHYIMVFTLNISSMITEAIGTDGRNAVGGLISNEINIIANTIQVNIDDDSKWAIFAKDDATYTDPETGKEYTMSDVFAHILILTGIIVITIMYLFKYFDRFIKIIFLILISPIACLTYPIDKVGDRKIASI